MKSCPRLFSLVLALIMLCAAASAETTVSDVLQPLEDAVDRTEACVNQACELIARADDDKNGYEATIARWQKELVSATAADDEAKTEAEHQGRTYPSDSQTFVQQAVESFAAQFPALLNQFTLWNADCDIFSAQAGLLNIDDALYEQVLAEINDTDWPQEEKERACDTAASLNADLHNLMEHINALQADIAVMREKQRSLLAALAALAGLRFDMPAAPTAAPTPAPTAKPAPTSTLAPAPTPAPTGLPIYGGLFRSQRFWELICERYGINGGTVTKAWASSLTTFYFDSFDKTYAKDIPLLTGLTEVTLRMRASVLQTDDARACLAALAALPSLRTVNVFVTCGAGERADVSALCVLENIRQLYIEACDDDVQPAQIDLSPLARMTNLTNLSIDAALDIISPLSSLTGLDTLTLVIDPELLALAQTKRTLEALSALRALDVTARLDRREAFDLSIFSSLTALRSLSLRMQAAKDEYPLSYFDLAPLSSLTGLETLYLSGNLADLRPLNALKSLRSLTLFGDSHTYGDSPEYENVVNQINLAQIASLTGLESLKIIDAELESTHILSTMTRLLRLTLDFCRLEELPPLYSLARLEQLSLYWNDIRDVSMLLYLPNLTYVVLMDNPLSDRAVTDRLIAQGCVVVYDTWYDTDTSYSPPDPLAAGHTAARRVFVCDDIAFERAVRAALMRPTLPIYLDELSGIDTLDISGVTLSDPELLRLFYGLRALYARGCGLSGLACLENMTRLETLDISDNSIADVSPLLSLPALRQVNVSGNAALDELSDLMRRVREILENRTGGGGGGGELIATTLVPNVHPTATPRAYPTVKPTARATSAPTKAPTAKPTARATIAPTEAPSPFSALPELTAVRAVPGKGRLAVYTAPDTSSLRMANGKAQVSTQVAVYLYGRIGGWTLLHYAVTEGSDSGEWRMGYVKSKLTDQTLTLASLDAAIAYPCTLSDDPVSFKRGIGTLLAGERVTALARKGDYAYIEAVASGRIARGFVPIKALKIR